MLNSCNKALNVSKSKGIGKGGGGSKGSSLSEESYYIVTKVFSFQKKFNNIC